MAETKIKIDQIGDLDINIGIREEEVEALIDAALSNTISKLSTTTVQTNVAAKQDLFTVPTGKDCIVTLIIARNASGDLTNMADYTEFIFGTGSINTIVVRGLLNSLFYSDNFAQIVPPDFTQQRIGHAGETLGAVFLDTAFDETIVIDVFGYLVDA